MRLKVTVKNLKNLDTLKIAVIVLEFEQYKNLSWV